MRGRSAVLAALVYMAPVGAQAADLVVWWEKGYYAEEDAALAEVIAAFEQETGQLELALQETAEIADKILAALDADRPPDLAFAQRLRHYFVQWASDDRLVDLTDPVGSFSNLFDPDTLARGRLRHPETGRTALYGLPVGRSTNYLHVWQSLLEEAGFALGDIPKEWDAFWSFWCDQVQPAVRRTTDRDDIWGIGLNMSGNSPGETDLQFFQFVDAYEADYVSRDGTLVIDDPEIRRRLVRHWLATLQSIARAASHPMRSDGTIVGITRRSWRDRSS